MSNNFKIAETYNFVKSQNKIADKKLYSRIKQIVYPALKENPFYGTNIKKLKGKFENIYRFRIGSYRLFYTIDTSNFIIFILEIAKRKDAY